MNVLVQTYCHGTPKIDDPASPSLGLMEPFRCDDCTARGFLVSGPHSHICEVCGGKAFWGFYTTPRCADHRTLEQGGATP